jgi:hypothetical protein
VAIVGLGKSFAQTKKYHPFPEDSATWTVLFEYQSSPSNYSQSLIVYEIKGDTVFNNIAYNKIYKDGNYSCAIRQDTATRSVYFHGNYSGSLANDTLLYRFDYKQGDTAQIVFHAGRPKKILGVDSALVGNSYRKRFQTKDIQNYTIDEWIEGIGSDHFLFLPFDYEFEWGWTLICYVENGQQLYYHPKTTLYNVVDTCLGVPIGVHEESNIDHSLIFENPNSGIFTASAQQEIVRIEILDILGNTPWSKNISSQQMVIDLSSHPKGIYFLKSIDAYGNCVVRKLVLK